jgi:ABC-2 type transport system ATP-binding protein
MRTLGKAMSIPVIEVENLVKVYRGGTSDEVRAVDGMSFAVAKGSIFGLLGPNGAGKSTMLKVLTTLSRATSGSVKILGMDVREKPLEVRRKIAAVLQDTSVELFLSVRDNLITYGRFHGLSTRESLKRAEGVMEKFQLRSEADHKVQDLSGGYKRRVQVSKVFMVETPILFLDEFSTGMDPILKREVMASLRAEAEKGRTIVLTTQILSEAEELCDDILIMNKGKQVARGNLNTLKLLSQGVYDVVMTFDHMPQGIEQEVKRFSPIRVSLDHNTIEMTVKEREGRVLDVITSLARDRNVVRVELNSASLEDIFIELTKKKEQVA